MKTIIRKYKKRRSYKKRNTRKYYKRKNYKGGERERVYSYNLDGSKLYYDLIAIFTIKQPGVNILEDPTYLNEYKNVYPDYKKKIFDVDDKIFLKDEKTQSYEYGYTYKKYIENFKHEFEELVKNTTNYNGYDSYLNTQANQNLPIPTKDQIGIEIRNSLIRICYSREEQNADKTEPIIAITTEDSLSTYINVINNVFVRNTGEFNIITIQKICVNLRYAKIIIDNLLA